MSFAGGAFFTNKGKILHAKAIAGATLTFTRLSMGSGELSGQNISDLTAMINEVLSVAITSLKTLTGGKATVKGVMTNEGLATGFYWRELGLFATDPDLGEILYCYGNAGALAEYIPAGGGSEILEKVIGITAIVSDVASITATIAESLIYATQADFEDHLADYTLQVPYGGTTTNVGNAYSIAAPVITALSVGMAVSVKINNNSTGVTTLNWNSIGAKSILKANGSAVSNLKAGGIYTLRYDGTNFILQGEGGSGNATASDLLSGKTATVDAGDITGTLALTGSALAGDVLSGKTLYNTDPKTKLTGTMPSRGAITIIPGTVDQAIAAGNHNGAGKVVGDADLLSENIKNGVNIFGVVGTCSPTGIKSIQHIEGTISGMSVDENYVDVAINSVNTSKSAIIYLGCTFTNTPYAEGQWAKAEFTSATNVRIARYGVKEKSEMVASFVVVEFESSSLKTLQRGGSVISAYSTDINVTPVDTTRSILYFSGMLYTGNTTTDTRGTDLVKLKLSAANTINIATRQTITRTVYWTLVEFN